MFEALRNSGSNNGQEWVELLDGIFKISSPGNRYMAPPPPTITVNTLMYLELIDIIQIVTNLSWVMRFTFYMNVQS